jgi:hypothetical protein
MHPMMDSKRSIPNVAEILVPLLARVPPARQPLLLAIAERMAADRYRGWAEDPDCAAHRESLLACAAREEEIATRVEALSSDAASVKREIIAQNPDLQEINRTVFAGWPIEDQMRIQSAGERAGVAAWQAFAAAAGPTPAREAFLACARLEEESALVLDRILGS